MSTPEPMVEVMNLQELLRRAQEEVDRAELSDDLRAIAFSKVFDALRSDATTSSPAAPSKDLTRQVSEDDHLSKIAGKLGLNRDFVSDVFYIEGDVLEVTIPTSHLAKSKNGGAQQLALLVAAGRQAAGLDEEWTSSSTIRSICEHFGRFDSNNFAQTLAHMDDVFQIRGKQQNRAVRVRAQGYERARELIERLVGV